MGGLVVAFIGTVASAANGGCPNGMPFCFTADSPALATEVNHNFSQLKEWLENKAGATSSTALNAANGATIGNGATITPSLNVSTSTPAIAAPSSTGRALFVTGTTTLEDQPILDVRHTNLSQGVSFGWNTIAASGTATNQDLFLRGKGTGSVQVSDDFIVTGRATFNGRTCRDTATACQTQGGGEAVYLDRHDLNCNSTEYLKRVRLVNCGGGNMRFDFTCCAL